MDFLMYFKGSLIYTNNILLGCAAGIFLIFAIFRTYDFVGFYKKKFYLVFSINCYAGLLNAAHGLAVKHKVMHTTLFTESCVCALMFCFLLMTLHITYKQYLKFNYSFITKAYFKTLTYFVAFYFPCLQRNTDYYSNNYEELNTFDMVMEGPEFETEQKASDQMFESTAFRYMNYQILGNYLFAQVFTLYIQTCSFFVRALAIAFHMFPTNQLVLVNLLTFGFTIGMGFFDFKYRRFTKSFIAPHLTVLTFIGYWMFEYFDKFDQTRPEPVSTLNFILTSVYIVIKFAFLTDSSFYEDLNQKLKNH